MDVRHHECPQRCALQRCQLPTDHRHNVHQIFGALFLKLLQLIGVERFLRLPRPEYQRHQ